MCLAACCLAVAGTHDDVRLDGGKHPRTQRIGVWRIAHPLADIFSGELRPVPCQHPNQSVAMVSPFFGDVGGDTLAPLVSEFCSTGFRRFSLGLGGLTRLDAFLGE